MGLVEVFARLNYPHLLDTIELLGYTARDFAWVHLEAGKSGLEGAVLNFETGCLELSLGSSGAFNPDMDIEADAILKPVKKLFNGWRKSPNGGLEVSIACKRGVKPLSITAQSDGTINIPFDALPLTAKKPLETAYVIAMLGQFMYDWTPSYRTNFA
ncbi:hypothetical protein HYY74_00325 [Candidatus Woesearchaeota archaeon]|nr:hypothetical protein [Candidatus Woesearchaeota archaeon]